MFHQVRTSLSPENLREVYSYISKPFDLDEEYQRRIEQRSIILEPSNPMAKPNLMMFKFRCKNISSQDSAAPGLQRPLLLAAKPYFGSDPKGPKTKFYILFWVMQ